MVYAPTGYIRIRVEGLPQASSLPSTYRGSCTASGQCSRTSTLSTLARKCMDEGAGCVRQRRTCMHSKTINPWLFAHQTNLPCHPCNSEPCEDGRDIHVHYNYVYLVVKVVANNNQRCVCGYSVRKGHNQKDLDRRSISLSNHNEACRAYANSCLCYQSIETKVSTCTHQATCPASATL